MRRTRLGRSPITSVRVIREGVPINPYRSLFFFYQNVKIREMGVEAV